VIYGDKAGNIYSNEVNTRQKMGPVVSAHTEKISHMKVLNKPSSGSNYLVTAAANCKIKVWKLPTLEYIGAWEPEQSVESMSKI